MRSLCSFYANDVLWLLIFEEEQFSYNQTTQPPGKIKKNGNFTLFSQEGAYFAQYLKNVSTIQTYLFPAVIRFFVSCVFGNLNRSPKMGDFSSFCQTKGLPNGHFCHSLQCCHFCLFVCCCCFLAQNPPTRSSSCRRSRAPG